MKTERYEKPCCTSMVTDFETTLLSASGRFDPDNGTEYLDDLGTDNL